MNERIDSQRSLARVVRVHFENVDSLLLRALDRTPDRIRRLLCNWFAAQHLFHSVAQIILGDVVAASAVVDSSVINKNVLLVEIEYLRRYIRP